MGKKCVYCLQTFADDEITDDHIIPRAWYPSTAPQNLEKWQAPVCRGCNNEYSKYEEELLTHFAMCIDPNDPATAGIWTRMKRSLDESAGRDEKDSAARKRKLDRVNSSLFSLDALPKEGLLPGFERNFEQGSRTGVLIPGKPLHMVVRKWVRGFAFIRYGILLPEDDERVSVIHLSDEDLLVLERQLNPYWLVESRGEGVSVAEVANREDGFIAIYKFVLWNVYRVFGTIELSDHETVAYSVDT